MRPDHVPAELEIDFDRTDHALAGSVHELIGRVRETTPIAWTARNGGHWIVTRYSDVVEVFRTPNVFSSFPVGIPADNGQQDKLIPLELDGAEHAEYRRIISPLFAPARMAALEPSIRDLAQSLAASVNDAGECEFVSEFARPLPVTVFLLLMGWPLADADQLTEWTDLLMHGIPGASYDDAMQARIGAGQSIHEYFSALIAKRRREPSTTDFTSVLLEARLDSGEPIPEGRLLDMMMLLLHAGLDTVKSALAMGVEHLATNPSARQRLVDDPSLIPTTVEEILRWDPPAWPGRTVTQEVEFHGVMMRPGDRVLLAIAAANRDEAEFPAAEEMRLDREPNRHLAFSAGVHRCIGSHLARIEMSIALEEFLNANPDFELDPQRPPVRHLGGVFGLEHLHLSISRDRQPA